MTRRIQEALFPAVKTLEEFDFQWATHIPAALLRNLSEGGYLARKEPIIFLAETGTGKTHLATALAVAACRQSKRVRFATAAEMVTELIEAQNQAELTRVRNRWTRYDLIVIDELGYMVMRDTAAELLFQVIAGRAERAAVIVTTNLPFSEWTTTFPNAWRGPAARVSRKIPRFLAWHNPQSPRKLLVPLVLMLTWATVSISRRIRWMGRSTGLLIQSLSA